MILPASNHMIWPGSGHMTWPCDALVIWLDGGHMIWPDGSHMIWPVTSKTTNVLASYLIKSSCSFMYVDLPVSTSLPVYHPENTVSDKHLNLL